MLLILTNENDYSTHEVIDWLLHYQVPFIRLNESDKIEIKAISLNYRLDLHLEIKACIGKVYHLKMSEITSFWYRRGFLNIDFQFENKYSSSTNQSINEFLGWEINTIKDFIYLLLSQKKSVGSIYENNTNKLFNLYLANEVGLLIPNTHITTKKIGLKKFYKENNEKVISKALCHGLIRHGETRVGFYTTKVENGDVIDCPNSFYPSLFQELVNKKYELRIFYWKEKFYSSAIFSQLDEKTKIDFRHYNREKPNRVVPYELPIKVAEKLKLLMQKIGLKSGSIDMVVTNQNEFVFLEVNPIGQFNQVSKPCNYFLERKIAKYFQNEI